MKPSIKVTKSDYLNFPAEAIVNSANDMLVLGSNVAGRLGNTAGQQLVEFLRNIIASRKGKPFPLGMALETPAFNAGKQGLTRYIIHAISLGSRKYAPPEGRLLATVKTLFSAVLSALKLADDLGCRSIVYPVMLSRPGYSVIDTDSLALRWTMATALVLALKSGSEELRSIEKIYISVFNADNELVEHDYEIFNQLLRTPQWGQKNKDMILKKRK